jgi:hypothetical protein
MWIDTHCHTKYSYDNWLEPRDLIRRAQALGLAGICVTEHHSFEVSAPVEHIGTEEGLLVLRGVEISTDKGHILAYGVQDDGWNIWGRNTYIPIIPVIERIVGLGGICVPAHPYREVGVASLLDELFDLRGITAVETHNGNNSEHDNDLARAAANNLALPTFGGSDCHKSAGVGRCATEFYVPVTDIASFIDAVRAGACRGAYYPQYALGAAVAAAVSP